MNTLRLLLAISTVTLLGCQPAASGRPDSVTTQGTAELMVAPDQAEMIFGIEHRSKNLDDARDAAEKSVHALLEVTRRLGIPAERVDSTAIITRPEYRYDEGDRQFAGYYVARHVRITLHDIDLLGPLTDGAFEAGINTVEPPQLGVSNPREQYRRVLELAAEDARANAKTLATSLDARLGNVLSVTEQVVSGGVPPQMMMRASAEAAAPDTAMQAGQIRFTANVTADFELRH